MFWQSKIDRAVKYQQEQKEKQEAERKEYSGEKLYEPSYAEEMEKGDMLAMILAGCLTILPVCAGALLLIVLAGMLFMRIF